MLCLRRRTCIAVPLLHKGLSSSTASHKAELLAKSAVTLNAKLREAPSLLRTVERGAWNSLVDHLKDNESHGHVKDVAIASMLAGSSGRVFRTTLHPFLCVRIGHSIVELLSKVQHRPEHCAAAVDALRDLGDYLTDIGEYRSAAQHYRRGLELLLSSDPQSPSSERYAHMQLGLGRLLAKGAGMGKGYEAEARLMLELALHTFKKLSKATPDQVGLGLAVAETKAALSLVLTCQDASMFTQAEQLIEEAYEAQLEAGDALSLAETLNTHGLLLARQRRRGEARHCFKQNLARRRELYGSDMHPQVVESLLNCASVESDPEQSRRLYDDAVRALSTIYSDEGAGSDRDSSLLAALSSSSSSSSSSSNSSSTVFSSSSSGIGGNVLALSLAPALDGLGVALMQLHRPKEAAEAFRRALHLRREKLANHPDTADSATNLAMALILCGGGSGSHYSDAEVRKAEIKALLLEAVSVHRKIGVDSVAYGLALTSYVEFSCSLFEGEGEDGSGNGSGRESERGVALSADLESMLETAQAIFKKHPGQLSTQTDLVQELMETVSRLRSGTAS